MNQELLEILDGVLMDDQCTLSLAELSRACAMHGEWIEELVAEGILEPSGTDIRHWRFTPGQLERARVVRNLQRDLGVNLAGAALALELLDEIERLRSRLRRFDPYC